MKRAFGNVVYKLRKKANLTQVEFAEKSGLSQAEISLIEGGHRWPIHKTLNLLGKAFGVDPMEIMKFAYEEHNKPEAKKWRSLKDDNDEEESYENE